jgi:hypothetical protein
MLLSVSLRYFLNPVSTSRGMGRQNSQTVEADDKNSGDDDLNAYEVEVGQVYETETGVRVEVVEEVRESKPLVVEKSDRDRQERMSRYSFADMVNYEDMTLVEEAEEDSPDEDDDREGCVSGEFDTPVRCPECGLFMATGYGDGGLPSASCSNPDCHVRGLGDADLKRNGMWTETRE